MLKTGTLNELYMTAYDRVLNCLNLPMSSHQVVDMPGLRYVPTVIH